MFKYWRMKKNEIRIKSAIYEMIVSVMDNQAEIIELIQKLYEALKDVPAEDIQKELISNLAEFVHNDNKKDE